MKDIIFRILYLTFSLLISININAQSLDHAALDSISFEKAIEYSMHNSSRIKIRHLRELQDKEKLNQINIDYLPNVYLTSDLRRNIVIPTTPIPASMINPSASQDELMYMRFNTPWNSTAGVNLFVDLFNPETFGKRDEQKQQLRISKIESKIEESNISAITSQTYIDCLIAKEQLQYMIADTVYYSKLLHNVNDLYNKGNVSLADQNNVYLNYNKSISNFSQAQSIYYNSRINLLSAMGIEVNDENINNLSLSDNIESLYNRLSIQNLYLSGTSQNVVRQEEVVGLQIMKIKHTQLKYLPTLSLSAYYGANYYNHDLHITNKDKWFGNSYILLSLHIPITQALSNSKAVSQQRVQHQIEQQNLFELQNDKRANDLKEKQDLFLKMKQYDIKMLNLDLVRENLYAKQAEFEKGYILESDFMSEKLSHYNAIQDYLLSAHEALTVMINIINNHNH